MLCQQNQDINKDQLLGRKAFLYNKDITQLKAGKENIYKIQGGSFFFCVVFIMLKGLFRIFNLINRKALLAEGYGSAVFCWVFVLKKR